MEVRETDQYKHNYKKHHINSTATQHTAAMQQKCHYVQNAEN